MDKSYADTNTYVGYGLQLIILFIFMICMVLIASLMPLIIFDVTSTDDTNNILASLMINTLAAFIIPVLIWKVLFYKSKTLQEAFHFKPSLNTKLLLISISLIIISIPLMNFLGLINYELLSYLPSSIINQIDIFSLRNQAVISDLFKIELPIVIKIIALIVAVAILPAIGEELFFRSGIQYLLLKKTKSNVIAIIITSLIFAFVHFEFYGFFVRLFMGIILGYVFFKTGNVFYSIIIHCLFNGSQVIFILSTYNSEMLNQLGSIQKPSSDVYSISNIIIVIASLIYLYFVHKKRLLYATKRPSDF